MTKSYTHGFNTTFVCITKLSVLSMFLKPRDLLCWDYAIETWELFVWS
jgi:hypothetical protein